MATIVKHGKERNLTNATVGNTLVPDSAERQFVTFVNDLGGVHTIIADAETVFNDAEQFLAFFEHTKAIAHTSASEGARGHVTPQEVISRALEAVGAKPVSSDQQQGSQTQTTGEGATF